MLKSLLQALFGRPEPPTSGGNLSHEWRRAPERTWNSDLLEEVPVSLTVTTGHHGFLKVVGESHYQGALRSLEDRLGREAVFEARLVPEPDNPHDGNAVAVCVNDGLAKVGYLTRDVAKHYHARLVQHGAPVVCPARLAGGGSRMIGVVLDFEDARVALGFPRVSIDHGELDYEAIAEYHRLNGANREMVRQTRPLEKSNVTEALVRNRAAVVSLVKIQSVVRGKGLVGFEPNLTDAIPLERLTLCLVRLGRPDEGEAELLKFVEAFPHLRDSTLVRECRQRIDRAQLAKPVGRPPSITP